MDALVMPSRLDLAVERSVERILADLLGATGEGGGVVGVTSCREADDPAVYALAVAALLARHTEDDAVVIEASLRGRSRVPDLLGIPARPGVTDVLRRPELAGCSIRSTGEPRVSVLPSGADRAIEQPVGDAALARLIAEGLLRARWVVVVAPPLDARGDGDIVVRRCNQMILFAASGRGKRRAMRRATGRIDPDALVAVIRRSRRG